MCGYEWKGRTLKTATIGANKLLFLLKIQQLFLHENSLIVIYSEIKSKNCHRRLHYISLRYEDDPWDQKDTIYSKYVTIHIIVFYLSTVYYRLFPPFFDRDIYNRGWIEGGHSNKKVYINKVIFCKLDQNIIFAQCCFFSLNKIILCISY